jgi:hypothetical protein
MRASAALLLRRERAIFRHGDEDPQGVEINLFTLDYPDFDN